MGFNTSGNAKRLIVPAAIHYNNEHFPDAAKHIQFRNIHKYSNVMAFEGSNAMLELSEEIKNWAPDVRKAIGQAPPYDQNWRDLDIAQHRELFRIIPQ